MPINLTKNKKSEYLSSFDLNECNEFEENLKVQTKSDQDILQSVIKQHINSLCKKFCFDNRYQYQCTIDKSWHKSPSNAVLCEYGNGTYDWMLVELSHLKSSNDKKNITITFLEGYYRKIVSSSIFFERYKNWRFQRRIRVPDYIKILDKDACKVFWGLYDQDVIENIAQKLKRKECEIKNIVNAIYVELHKRKRSYILSKNTEFSLDDEYVWDEYNGDALKSALNDHSSVENITLKGDVMNAYKRLNWKEQYILDVMVIDELSASAVLQLLREQSISLDDKVSSDDLNIQHVYYFLRKTIIKLKQTSRIEEVEQL